MSIELETVAGLFGVAVVAAPSTPSPVGAG